MAEADPFALHRTYLFALAYRMLGSAADAEDVLQDTYLRYAAAPRDNLRVPRAYLTTITTRLCLDRLKAAHVTREQYVGPWLPEPVLTLDAPSDPQRAAERHESITLAFLVLLETLTPVERAVFLLREVFEYGYDEIGAIVQVSQANCRQIFHRAKAQLATQRPRFAAPPAQQHALVERFLRATERGDLGALQEVLAADVQMWADSGGKAPAPRRLVQGRDTIAQLMVIFADNTLQLLGGDASALRMDLATVNGEPAFLVYIRGALDTAAICSTDGTRITALHLVRNPEKLAFLTSQLAAGNALPL